MQTASSLWARVGDLASIVATPLVPSDYLSLIAPRLSLTPRYARVEDVREETRDATTITLRPGRGFRPHRPGQYVAVGVEIGGRILTRTYSISSSPDREDGLITITVKAQPGGRVSRALAFGARRGDHLVIGQPEGEFVMSDVAPERALFVTGGSGITPIMSMLRTFALRGAMPDVVHLHYAPKVDDVIFRRELQTLATQWPSYRLALLETDRGAPLLDRESLARLAPDFADREAWACGPEPLLAAAEAQLPRVHVERFRPKLAPAATDAGGRVRFARSRRGLDASGATPLLEAAESAGVNAPHGCRMGICHTCDTTLIAGCVRDLRTNAIIDEPGARIQPCVCAAAGDVELDL